MLPRRSRRRLFAAGGAIASLASSALVLGSVQTASAAGTHTWDGDGGNTNWTNAANWDAVPAPGAGDDLVFPAHAANEQPNNDFGAGATFNSISVLDNQYQLVGNAIETPTVDLTNPDAPDCGNFQATTLALGNSGTSLIVPNGGTTTIGFDGPGQAFLNSTQVDIGADDLVLDGTADGLLRGFLSLPTAAVGHSVTRTGGGVATFTGLHGGPGVPMNFVNQSGTTYLDENTTYQLRVTQTGGEFGGRGALQTYAGSGGVYSPANQLSCPFTGPSGPSTVGSQNISSALTLGAGLTYRVDMTSNQSFDRVFAQDQSFNCGTGDASVTLGGTLEVNPVGFVPTAGGAFAIVGNDCVDPVVGTFAGLANGATFQVDGIDMTIRYDRDAQQPTQPGNDVVLFTEPAFVWDGNGGNGNWSNDLNWVGGAAPEGLTGQETLIFPSLADPADVKATTNDVGGTFKDIVIDNAQYTFAGQAIVLNGNYTGNNGADTNTFNVNVTFVGGGTVQLPNGGASVTFAAGVNAGGGTVTLTGQGNATFGGALTNGQLLITNGSFATVSGNSPAFAGPVTVDASGRGLILTGTLGASPVLLGGTNFGFYGGDGSAHGITGNAGTLSPSDNLGDPAELVSTNGLALSGNLIYGWEVEGPLGDQLDVDGPVDISNSILTAAMTSDNAPPVANTTYTIIDNDGVDPVVGTFRHDSNPNDPNNPLVALPDGSVVFVGGFPLTVDYSGGDGNDVTLSVVNADVWDGGGANNNWSTGANWVDDTAPTAGATLIFPDGADATSLTNTNDLAVGFADLTFSGTNGGYSLGGNTITLSGDINNGASNNGTNTITADVTLTGGGIATGVSGASLTFSPTSAVDIGGGELQLQGRHAVNLNGTFSNGQIDVDFQPGGFGGSALLDTDQATLSGGVEVDEGTFVFFDDIAPGGLTVHAGGTAVGSGTIAGAVVNDGGFVSLTGPANAKGTVTAQAGFSQTAGGISFRIDGAGAGQFDQLAVTGGTVTIGGTLGLSTEVVPPFGQSVPIVLVPGTDPAALTGAFTNAADGATVQISGGGPTFDAVIDYTGGDGNDITITLPPTFTWDGGAVSNDMTVAQNWVNDVAPTGDGGETLVFPDGATDFTPVNDFDPVTKLFTDIRFTGGNTSYTVSGNQLVLDGDVLLESGFANQTISAPLQTSPTSTLRSNSAGVLAFTGTIDAGGNPLVVDGFGGIAIADVNGPELVKNGVGTTTLTGAITTLGAVTLNAGQLVVLDDVGAPITVDGGSLQGNGTADGIDANLGNVSPGASAAAVFTSTGGFDLAASSDLVLDVNGTVPGTDHDQLDVTSGDVVLAGDLDLNGFTPIPPATTVTILDKGSAGAITGTFAGLPEGATVLAGDQSFTISYVGGDGNDVVLTAGPVASLSDDAVTIVEGDAGTTDVGLAVLLDAASASDVEVTVTATGGDAADGTDFTLTEAVTVAAGQTSAAVSFEVAGDELAEVDETVEVSLAIVSGARLGTPAAATVTIDDDDLSTLTVTDPVVQITEGGAGGASAAATSTLTITLDGPSEDPIDVDVDTADGSATAPADYAAVAATFTIPAGTTSFDVPLSVVPDGVDEPDETFTVAFSGVTGGVDALADITVTILDDDLAQIATTTTAPGTGGTGGTGGAGGTGGSGVARTGSESGPVTGVGVLLVALGGLLVVAGRRRSAFSEDRGSGDGSTGATTGTRRPPDRVASSIRRRWCRRSSSGRASASATAARSSSAWNGRGRNSSMPACQLNMALDALVATSTTRQPATSGSGWPRTVSSSLRLPPMPPAFTSSTTHWGSWSWRRSGMSSKPWARATWWPAAVRMRTSSSQPSSSSWTTSTRAGPWMLPSSTTTFLRRSTVSPARAR